MRAALVALSVLALSAASAARPIVLAVDATDAPRKLFHAQISIPVTPGPNTLVYPRWAYNAPTGAAQRIVRLELRAGDKRLDWRRDPVDLFAFHVTVPPGTTTVTVGLDVVAPSQAVDGLGAATAQLFVLEWQNLFLYPQGGRSDTLTVRAELKLPPGWQHASSLPSQGEGTVAFPEVTLAELVDAPVLAGKNFRSIPLTAAGAPPMSLDIAAESPGTLDVTKLWQDRIVRVVREAGALFGGYPYPSYRFLLALSDELGDDGLEHQRSADLRMAERAFTDENYRLAFDYLIPHEYAHAWNGLHRRPAAVATKNFQDPQVDDLLWVYEGLTRYLNWVLAARSGIFSPDEARDYVAYLAGKMESRSGRTWRSLGDTAVSAPFLYFAPSAWQSQRREVDAYDESLLVWLEVDATLRRLSGGTRSLDDFCRAFFHPAKNDARFKTYVLADVIAALNSVAKNDWAGFFHRRIDATSEHVPLDGLEASGWRLAYGAAPGSVQAAREATSHTIDERAGLGFLAAEDGTLIDVVGRSAAWDAGLGPGMQILSVKGAPWSKARLREVIAAKAPVELKVQNGSQTFATVVKNAGPRHPRLERNDAPDTLADVLRPRVP